MRTEPANEHEANAEHLRRLVAQLEALGARIAFLAQALRLPLHTPAEAQAALQCDAAAAQGREARMREELRGLLVLRYDVFVQLAADESIGAQAARDILLCANDRLLCKGFALGAPGMDLRPLFDGIDD